MGEMNMTQTPSIAETRCARYDESLSRFADWLGEHQDPDGSLQGQNLSCNAYMPLPLFAHATGRHELALRAWHILETRYMRDGQLVQTEARRNMIPYTPAWLVMVAAMEENFRLRSSLVRLLLSFQDPRTGGFFGSVAARDAGSGVIDFDSTTQACAALCVAGLETAAAKCGRFLRNLVQAQPDPDRQLFLQWDTARGLIPKFRSKNDDGPCPGLCGAETTLV